MREEVEDREREEGGRRINEVEGEGHRKGEREKVERRIQSFPMHMKTKKLALLQHSNFSIQICTHN